MTDFHHDRQRAGTFGDDAAQYDRARPAYPAALVDDLLRGDRPDVLDVGCGTGIAGALFAARGCRVLGVEPDERMAAVARIRGLTVDLAPFEQWDPAGRHFDLVVAGQAWHWVDPRIGAPKAARVLRPRGHVALFWNHARPEASQRIGLDAVYARLAPHLLDDSVLLGGQDPGWITDRHAAGLRSSGEFEEPTVRAYRWEKRYTRDECLDLLPTQSDHRLLGPERLHALLDAVRNVLDAAGGELSVTYETVLVHADRRESDPTD
jgi:SAM-dependent methyltransferase